MGRAHKPLFVVADVDAADEVDAVYVKGVMCNHGGTQPLLLLLPLLHRAWVHPIFVVNGLPKTRVIALIHHAQQYEYQLIASDQLPMI